MQAKYILPLVAAVVILGAGVAAHAWLGGSDPVFGLFDHRAEIESEQALQGSPPANPSAGTLHIPIIIYHSVRPDNPGETRWQKEFSVTPELLDQQLAYLEHNGYTVISMDQLMADLNTGTTSPVAKPVVLTFDDGWKSQYTYALPLLEKYHDTATFYIYTNPIGKSPHFMTWEDLQQLVAAGMTIGDHTTTHPYLSRLSAQQLQHEVTNAKQVLESRLGIRVVHFASPFGYTSPELVSLLQADGFETGRTTYKGAHHSKDDVLRLTGFLASRDMHDFEWAIQYAP